MERAGLLGQSFESCFPFAGVLSRWAPCFSWSSTFRGWSLQPSLFQPCTCHAAGVGNPARAPRGSGSSLKPSLTPFPARPCYLPIDSGRALADGLRLLLWPPPRFSQPSGFHALQGVAPLSSRGPGTPKPCQTMPNASPISSLFELRFALVVCKHSCCCFIISFSFFFSFFLSCCKIYLDFYLPGPNSLIL